MITLSSDFGTPYPAAMKGVILERTEAQLVDVSHDFPRGDLRAAAFWLREVLPYFPPAVHLVVVDPGVGTDRKALVLRAGDHVLVGPDNGVLRPAARRLAAALGDAGREPSLEAYAVDDEDAASSTFHGRDVFAPAAAEAHEVGRDGLASVPSFHELESDELVDLRLPEATIEGDRVTGEVLVVDDFGNVITNVPGDFLEGRDAIRVVGADRGDSSGTATGADRVADGVEVPVGETFASVAPGRRLVTVGSHGLVELDVNQGRGDEAFGLEAGDAVVLEG